MERFSFQNKQQQTITHKTSRGVLLEASIHDSRSGVHNNPPPSRRECIYVATLYIDIIITHNMLCIFTACLGTVGMALEAVAEVMEDEPSLSSSI